MSLGDNSNTNQTSLESGKMCQTGSEESVK